MPRMRSVSREEVDAVADRLRLDLAAGEAEAVADRMNALADVYAELEAAPVDALRDRPTGEDRFAERPYRPGDDEDPYNAWLARFDLRRDAGGPLDGVDVAVKDNMAVRGVELTNGSRAFEGVVPGDHAAVVDRLLDAGARIVGKTNMDELAFGPTSETSAFGPTGNPAAPGHVAGGSSSGSAAAVAAGEVDLALGSDTGGSVRIPASYCGIVGVKPTYGLVPRYGFAELAYSMDHIGTLAPDVETAARGLDAIADPPPGEDEAGFADAAAADPSSLSIGVAGEFFERHVSDAVDRVVRNAIDRLDAAGAAVREVSIPALEYSRAAWWGIAPAEFAAAYAADGSGLRRRAPAEPTLAAATRRVRRASSRDLGTDAKAMLALGAHLDETHGGAHHVRAGRLRAALTDDLDAALDDVDVLAAPSTPTTALELGGFERGVTPPVNWDTHPINLTGHPAISLPCGEDDDGLPVGLQLIGDWYGEATVLGAARAFEGL